MEVKSYLRLALMFGDNNASTFSTNLEKMICLALFDHNKQGMIISDIIDELKDKYALEFSDAEVLHVISKKQQRRIVCIEEYHNASKNKYAITPEEFNRIKRKTDETSLETVIAKFLEKHADVEMNPKNLQDLLLQYFYDVFNTNADTILALMNKESGSLSFEARNYTETQKRIINQFIYWNDTEKNKSVYELISCCFDYCMMTVKKDKNVYNQIFKNKTFFLDTNIIFRLMGLNNESRKKVIVAFIKKCEDVGIQISYTNFTKKELEDTIDHYVDQIKNLFRGSVPISIAALARMDEKAASNDFYAEYVRWCERPENTHSDYEKFKRDLKRQAFHILSSYRMVSYEDYSGRPKVSEHFSESILSLKEYKTRHYRRVVDTSLKADINNYFYIKSLNNQMAGDDFFSVNNYIITADHAFSGWERDRRPGTIPTVVLPSVWYSIILQYAGRTNDDYLSFTRFLYFSFSDMPENEDPRKMEILRAVLALNEPAEIKERTIFDISDKLQKDYVDLDTEDVVQTSHQFIIDELLAKEKENAEIEKNAAIQAAMDEYDSNILIIKNQSSEEQKSIREELEQLRKQHKIDIDTAKKETSERLINQLVNKQLPKTLFIYWIITLLMSVCILVLFVKSVSIAILIKPSLEETYDGLFTKIVEMVVPTVFTVGSGFIEKYVIDNVFCGLKSDEIEKKVRKKIERTHRLE